jgi:acetyl-CoA C-acetyltransferase
MNKPVFIATYHQSKFGKLMNMSVSDIVKNAVTGACAEIKVTPDMIGVGSIGAACSFSLDEQGLLAGLMAMIPGMQGKPIEAVENACATGGQAIISVIQKLQLGLGDVGIAVGFEKMRDNEGRMDGKMIGRVLGYFSRPEEREGKVFIFPHLFAEVMDAYIRQHKVTEQELAQIAVAEYAEAMFLHLLVC